MDLFDINIIYGKMVAVFCREPATIFNFPVPMEDLEGTGLLEKVVKSARKLQERGQPATIEALAAMGCGTIEELVAYERSVTKQMQLDWPLYPRLIRLAAQKRRQLEWHTKSIERLVKTPLLELSTHNTTLRQELASLTTDVSRQQSTEIGDLLDEIVEGTGDAETLISDPVETGIVPIDRAMGGGIRPNQIVVIGAAQKNGKTTVLRYGGMCMALGGTGFLHAAADGGNRHKHACIYVGMRSAWYAIQAGIPTTVRGYDDDALSWQNVGIWMHNLNKKKSPKALLVPISKELEEALEAGFEDMHNLRQHGLLDIVDPKITGYDIDNLGSYITSAYYNKGIRVVAIDHVGKFGDKGSKNIFERYEYNAKVLIELASTLDISLIVLSQRNAQGVKVSKKGATDDDDDDWSTNLEGGKMWEQEADIIFTLLRPSGDLIKMRRRVFRDGESNTPSEDLKVHPGTGLILDGVTRYTPPEGY
jgi:hypothetical protein